MATKATQKEAKLLAQHGDKLMKDTTIGLEGTSRRGKELNAAYFSQPEAERIRRLRQNYTKYLADKLEPAKINYNVTNEELKDLIRVSNEADLYEFDQFFGQSIDFSDPAQARFAYEIYPDYFEKKEAEVERHLSLQRRLALIRNYGPRSKEDYMLLWQIEEGLIAIPDGPAFKPRTLEPEQKDKARGLLNIHRFFVSRPQGGFTGKFDGDKFGGYRPRGTQGKFLKYTTGGAGDFDFANAMSDPIV